MTRQIAIIGAGFAGLVLARALSSFARVQVFEKARGVGGRMSTRYADPYYFDHGAQFFTARTEKFRQFIAPYIASGEVAEWKGKTIILEEGKEPEKDMWFEPHYVAAPNMNSLCKKLAEGVPVTTGTEVAPLSARQQNGWFLKNTTGETLGLFDWVISTAPPAQTARIFDGHTASGTAFAQVTLVGCYALMMGYRRPWDRSWIAARVRNHPFQWIGVNSSKPGRNLEVTCLVAHSSHEWAEAHINDDMGEAQAFLQKAWSELTGIDAATADFSTLHRWRYALVSEPQALAPYCDASLGLASTGDWCGASRIEEVWQNATALAALLRSVL